MFLSPGSRKIHHRRFKRLFHSVFTKLLVTILVAGAAITLTAMVSWALLSNRLHNLSDLDRNLMMYAEYLIRDIGDPPNMQRAAEIVHRTGLAIRFDHPQNAWQAGEIPKSLHLDRGRMRRFESGLWAGHTRGHFFVSMHHGGGELTFVAPRKDSDFHAHARWFFVGMVVVLLIILAGAYFFIRRVLQPLHALEDGVEALSHGRLDHRVAEIGDDEFRELAEAFNTMTKRLSALLTSKEHLLLDMSHELRSPLTRMKVQLEFLSDDEARMALHAEVTEMEAMVTGILEEARLRSSVATLKREPIDLADLIRSVAGDFKQHSPGVVCEALEPVEVIADREKMRILLRNLLDNAMKHTSDRGDPAIVTLARKPASIAIVIHDHGEGIPAKALAHIFEPFFRADSSRSRKTGGYGLGLSLCKAIVDAHQGRIEISSIVGKGTRVEITLPLS